MRDHKDADTMTVQDTVEQGRRDRQDARQYVAERFLESTSPEDRAAALRVLDTLGAVALDRLSTAIETDGLGNPLYLYGNRMVWSAANDLTELAQHAAHTLRVLASSAGTAADTDEPSRNRIEGE